MTAASWSRPEMDAAANESGRRSAEIILARPRRRHAERTPSELTPASPRAIGWSVLEGSTLVEGLWTRPATTYMTPAPAWAIPSPGSRSVLTENRADVVYREDGLRLRETQHLSRTNAGDTD